MAFISKAELRNVLDCVKLGSLRSRMSLLRELAKGIDFKTKNDRIAVTVWFFFKTNPHATEVDRDLLWPLLEEVEVSFDFIARLGQHFTELSRLKVLESTRRGHYRLTKDAAERYDNRYGARLKSLVATDSG